MGKEQEPTPQEETNREERKNSGEKKEDAQSLQAPISKKEQEAFIHDVEETENLIDPGNEHRHIADE